jgi:hypothetical protein
MSRRNARDDRDRIDERSILANDRRQLPPMKKISTKSNGVICLPGRLPASRTINTRKQYPNAPRITSPIGPDSRPFFL